MEHKLYTFSVSTEKRAKDGAKITMEYDASLRIDSDTTLNDYIVWLDDVELVQRTIKRALKQTGLYTVRVEYCYIVSDIDTDTINQSLSGCYYDYLTPTDIDGKYLKPDKFTRQDTELWYSPKMTAKELFKEFESTRVSIQYAK